jgi:ligand-binding SRPBCC domain-containing protein
MYKLIYEQIIPLPLAQVFDFFQRPENLSRLTPPWLGFKIVTPPPLVMAKGLEIDYRIRLLGVPVSWRSRITRYEPPTCFVDEQISGPYQLWRHTHQFVEEGNKTRVIDQVEYALYGGPFGRWMHALYVRRSLENIFNYRAQALRPLLSLPPT